MLDPFSIFLAFVEGLVLIISPCILPILPLFLIGSISGGKSRPFGIIAGFIAAFALVTLFSKYLVMLFGINPSVIRTVAYALLLIIGVILLSDYLSEKVNMLMARLISLDTISSKTTHKDSFWSGVAFGSLVGIIWSPCAGPILAAVIVQSILQKTTLNSVIVVFSFAVGVGIPMLFIALLGRRVMKYATFLRDKSSLVRKILGALIILGTVLAIYSTPLILAVSKTQSEPTYTTTSDLQVMYPAPAISGITSWINSPPLSLAQLKGKVVLLDFWTYSCINCIRAVPHIKELYSKYHDQGLIVIGVHSPEFAFEHSLANVQNAVKRFGISYPVALDNNFKTWQNYNNLYWPTQYVIDRRGDVVYGHAGEGNNNILEAKIRDALGLPDKALTPDEVLPSNSQTPEIYVGFSRAANFSSPEVPQVKKVADYTYPPNLVLHNWALEGKWIIHLENIVAQDKNASIKIHFHAKKVYAVMGSQQGAVAVKIKLNNQLMTVYQGFDVKNGRIVVAEHRLYSLVELNAPQDGILELIVNSPGLEIFTFVFGN